MLGQGKISKEDYTCIYVISFHINKVLGDDTVKYLNSLFDDVQT